MILWRANYRVHCCKKLHLGTAALAAPASAPTKAFGIITSPPTPRCYASRCECHHWKRRTHLRARRPAHPQNGCHSPTPKAQPAGRVRRLPFGVYCFSPKKKDHWWLLMQWPFLRTAERTWRGWLGSRNFKLTLCPGRTCDGHHNRADFMRRLRANRIEVCRPSQNWAYRPASIQTEIGVEGVPKIHSASVLGVAVRTFLPGRRPLSLNASMLSSRTTSFGA